MRYTNVACVASTQNCFCLKLDRSHYYKYTHFYNTLFTSQKTNRQCMAPNKQKQMIIKCVKYFWDICYSSLSIMMLGKSLYCFEDDKDNQMLLMCVDWVVPGDIYTSWYAYDVINNTRIFYKRRALPLSRLLCRYLRWIRYLALKMFVSQKDLQIRWTLRRTVIERKQVEKNSDVHDNTKIQRSGK